MEENTEIAQLTEALVAVGDVMRAAAFDIPKGNE